MEVQQHINATSVKGLGLQRDLCKATSKTLADQQLENAQLIDSNNQLHDDNTKAHKTPRQLSTSVSDMANYIQQFWKDIDGDRQQTKLACEE